MNILILGGSGLLGGSLTCYLRDKTSHNVIVQSRDNNYDTQFDPKNIYKLIDNLIQNKIQIIINLIAATDIEFCESNIKYSYDLNVHINKNIANAIINNNMNIHVIHLSTDQVYSNNGKSREDDVSPVNVYGLSKYTGELQLNNLKKTILRTNFYGRSKSPKKKSFSDWIFENVHNNNRIIAFDDVLFSGVHMDELCKIIRQIIDEQPLGVFNFGCRDFKSKANFIIEFANKINSKYNNIKKMSITDNNKLIKRPLDMTLDVKKIEKILNYRCPTINEQILILAKEYGY